jgi:hypothetical protein
MPKTTPNLSIQLPNPSTDGNDSFNLNTMVNAPIETIDNAFGAAPSTLSTTAKTVVPAVNELSAKLTSASIQSTSLKHGWNYVPANEASPLNVTVQGRTLVNLLGNDGNFEFDSNSDGLADGWNGSWSGATISIATTNVTYGSKAQKIQTNAGDTAATRYVYKKDMPYELGKYYIGLVDVITDGTSTAVITMFAGTDYRAATRTTSGLLYTKGTYTSASGSTNRDITARNNNPQGTVGWVQFDGFRVFEIDSTTYAKIDVDPEYTGDKLAEKFPYVDGIKHLNGFYINKPGKNLIPPFTDLAWTLHVNATVKSQYELVVIATASGQNSTIDIPCIASAQYTFKGTGIYRVDIRDANLTWISDQLIDTSQGTFTTPSNAKFIRIVARPNAAGTFTFTNPQLELGAVATPFEPRNDDYLYVPTMLAGVNGVYDSFDSRTGRVTRRWVTDVILDGSLTWTFSTDFPGYKVVYTTSYGASKNGSTITAKYMVTKYNGTPLPKDAGANETASQMTGADKSLWADSSVVISIADSDSGWGETYTPTAAEIQAYFNGWRMGDASSGWSAYNGTGTKAWGKMDAKGALVGGSGSTILPTVMSDQGFTPYKITYQLAKPIDETVAVEGSISLHSGGNQIEVGEGVIVREPAKPKLFDSISDYYIINSLFTGPEGDLTASALKYRLNKFIAIYRNGLIDSKWVFESPGKTYGNQQAKIALSDYDPSAEYTVTYMMLDKYGLTSNVVDVAAEYQGNIEMLLRDMAKRQADNTEAITILQNTKANRGQGQWVPATLIGGATNTNLGHPVVSYRKSDTGRVQIRGHVSNVTNNVAFMVLPKDYRPKYYVVIPTGGKSSTGDNVTVNIDYQNGNVLFYANTGTITASVIPWISFDVEQ